jgi:hypothetical protein
LRDFVGFNDMDISDNELILMGRLNLLDFNPYNFLRILSGMAGLAYSS